jgi:hypothetical protein
MSIDGTHACRWHRGSPYRLDEDLGTSHVKGTKLYAIRSRRRAKALLGATGLVSRRNSPRAHYNVLQETGPDSIGVLLILLDLLEREAELSTKLRLRHVEHLATHSDSVANQFVDLGDS